MANQSGWSCGKCTYLNKSDQARCEMCVNVRNLSVKKKSLSLINRSLSKKRMKSDNSVVVGFIREFFPSIGSLNIYAIFECIINYYLYVNNYENNEKLVWRFDDPKIINQFKNAKCGDVIRSPELACNEIVFEFCLEKESQSFALWLKLIFLPGDMKIKLDFSYSCPEICFATQIKDHSMKKIGVSVTSSNKMKFYKFENLTSFQFEPKVKINSISFSSRYYKKITARSRQCKELELYKEERTRRDECLVCMDNDSSYAFIPCGHLCACAECKDLVDQCPRCGESKKKIKIFY